MISLQSKAIVDLFQQRIRDRVRRLEERGCTPHLAVVLVGADEQSLRYVAIKSRIAKQLGITLSLYHLDETEGIEAAQQTMEFLASDEEVHGVILQLPLPDSLAEHTDSLIATIPPTKDVDGLTGAWEAVHYAGVTQSLLEQPQVHSLPPMVGAVLSLLDHYHISLDGKNIVVVGQGRLVGLPVTKFLQMMGCKVSAVDEQTQDIFSITKQADILITGTGEPDLVTYQWVKEGVVVINCAQDVHEDSVAQVAEALSPATGGVSPLTVCWLLHNVVSAAERGVV